MSLTFLRLRVEDFRGVSACEVRFAERGVTVIHAPNETGKSSLLEAAELLLTTKDRSNAGNVRRVRPIGRDVGSLVELELRCGIYHLTCRKRFHRQYLTELTVHEPAPEQLAGEEAHNRLVQILGAEVDEALRRALWFEQGRRLEGVALGRSTALAAALDAVAGGSGVEVDDALFARVTKEFEKYFTPTGQDASVLKQSAAKVAAAQAGLQGVEAELARLNDDLADLRSVAQEIGGLEVSTAALAGECKQHQEALEQVERLTSELSTLQAQMEAAAGRHDGAARDVGDREALVERVAALTLDVAQRDAALRPVREELQELRTKLVEAEETTNATEGAARETRKAHEVAEAVAALVRTGEELARLSTALERADRAAEGMAATEAFLQGCAVTESLLSEIRRADVTFQVAQSQLLAARPSVTVRAQVATDVTVDGAVQHLEAGEQSENAISDRLVVALPDLVTVEVTAGKPATALRQALDDAKAGLADLCASAHVADLTQAEQVLDERRRQEQARDEARSALESTLADRTREELRVAQEACRATVADLQARAGEHAGAVAAAEAEQSLAGAKAAADKATATFEAARAERDVRRQQGSDADKAIATDEALLERLRADLVAAIADLETAREQASDEVLRNLRQDADQQRLAAVARVDQTGTALGELDPDTVRTLAENATKRLDDAKDGLSKASTRQIELRTRVGGTGEKGLGEQRENAATELEGLHAADGNLRARAEAARALHSAMVVAREDAYRSYREPLRQAIVEIARIVFGGTFDTGLDDELAIAERTLDGITVPWDDLSSGAKEQLGVISALAAARLASDGGAPLILDDTFGYSDPDRLERIGAVLGAVSDTQVIVLTCEPDRFRRIGGAMVVSLREAIAGAATPTTVTATELEELVCEACGKTWHRPRARGRKPARCPDCV